MDEMSFEMFKRELERQCEFALLAIEDLKKAVSLKNASGIWSSIHAFLVAAGNISKILWPI